MSHPFCRSERAPVFKVFGPHASRVALLVRERPTLLRRLAYAPSRAVHAVGAWLHLSPDADQNDDAVAAIVDESNPRDLLRAILPDTPRTLYKALDRAGDQVLEQSFYRRLGKLCSGPLSGLLLSTGPLSEQRLEWAEKLLEADPVIHSVGSMLPLPHQIEALHVLVTCLRSHGAIREDDLMVPMKAGPQALLRRLHGALDRLSAPASDFPPIPPFRTITTVGQLRAAGKVLNNCVKDTSGVEHWAALAMGTATYVTNDDITMLAKLEKVAPDIWHVGEMRGRENQRVTGEVKEFLIATLRGAGLRLVSQGLAQSLWALTSPMLLDDVEGDLDEDVALAGVAAE